MNSTRESTYLIDGSVTYFLKSIFEGLRATNRTADDMPSKSKAVGQLPKNACPQVEFNFGMHITVEMSYVQMSTKDLEQIPWKR